MDDRFLMILANLLAIAGGFVGIRSARKGENSRFTIVWMIGAFAVQCIVLAHRGEAQGRCPIVGLGEIFFFLGWALTLFYLLVGSAYRLSFLGTFTAPLVIVFQQLAVMPGIYQAPPLVPAANVDPWLESHASFSLLAYGALALSAVAAVMFLIQDRHLKQHNLDDFSQKMPSVRQLSTSTRRLCWLGVFLLTVGIVCGFITPKAASSAKLWVACGVWALYAGLIGISLIRGLPARQYAKAILVLFVLSLSVLFLR